MLLNYDPRQCLPSAEDLPDSDDTPVDNQLQSGEPVWLEELALGIGREEGTYQGITREWLYWYDRQGNRYLSPEERLQEAQQQIQEAQRQALEAQQKAQRLEERLHSLGIEPNGL